MRTFPERLPFAVADVDLGVASAVVVDGADGRIVAPRLGDISLSPLSAARSKREPDVEKIGDCVYHLPDVVGGPSILLGQTVVLVDTGVPDSDEAILAAVEEIGRSAADVTDIVITHADGDHVGSLSALVARTGATVWAGDHEADVIEGKAPARRGDTNRTATVDRRFVPGETLPLQGGIETVDTHGHTAGHVSLFPAAGADSDRRRRNQQRGRARRIS